MPETNNPVMRYEFLRETEKSRIDAYYGINKVCRSPEIIRVLDDVGVPNLGYLDSLVIYSEDIDRKQLAPEQVKKVDSEINLLKDLIDAFRKKKLCVSAILTIDLVIEYRDAQTRFAIGTDDQLEYKKKADNLAALKERIVFEWENPETYELYWELDNAIKKENYEEAAGIREKINAKKREAAYLPGTIDSVLDEVWHKMAVERKL